MKRHKNLKIFHAALILLVSSCENKIALPENTAIPDTIYISTEKANLPASEGNTASTDIHEFGLSAHLGKSNPSIADYAWNVRISSQDNLWKSDKPLFWMNGEEIMFFAYYPYIRQTADEEFPDDMDFRISGPGELPCIYYNACLSADGHHDILASSATGCNGTISLTFKHILSQIRFVSGPNVTGAVTIGNISLCGISGSGKYDLTTGAWDVSEEYSDYILDSNSFHMTNMTMPETPISDNAFMFPPQRLSQSSGAHIKITIIDDGHEEARLIPLDGYSWEEGYQYTYMLSYDEGEFSISGTEKIEIGSRIPTLEGLRYCLDSSSDKCVFAKEGGSGIINVKSYLREEYLDNSFKETDISCKTRFSMDLGKTWSSDIPDMFSSFSRSGTGSSEGDFLEFSVLPADEDRKCILSIIQPISNKEIRIAINQHITEINAAYLVEDNSDYTSLCTAVDGNIPLVILDDGTKLINDDEVKIHNYSFKFPSPGYYEVRIIFDCSSQTCEKMFDSCYNLYELDLDKLNTSEIRSFKNTFRGCSNLISLDIGKFDTGNTEDMSGMFSNCTNLEYLNLENFKTDKVTDMGRMFEMCENLTGLDLSSFNTHNVKNMSQMFHYCWRLTDINLLSFETVRLVHADQMFSRCYSLQDISMPLFYTYHVKTFHEMFYRCTSLENLDLRNFRGWGAEMAGGMFRGCSNLKKVDMRNLSFKSLLEDNQQQHDVQGMEYMFEGCGNLSEIYMDLRDIPDNVSFRSMFNGCRQTGTIFTVNGIADDRIIKELGTRNWSIYNLSL